MKLPHENILFFSFEDILNKVFSAPPFPKPTIMCKIFTKFLIYHYF